MDGHLLEGRDEGTVHQSEEPVVVAECQGMRLTETVVAVEEMGIQHTSLQGGV